MLKKLRHQFVASVGIIVLLLVSLAGPASAGYREGRISCQDGWTVFTESYANDETVHKHYLEPYPIETGYADFVFTAWINRRTYGTWSVEAASLVAGGGFCGRV